MVSGGIGPLDPNTNLGFRTDTWVLTNANGREVPLNGLNWVNRAATWPRPALGWLGLRSRHNRLMVFGGQDGTDETIVFALAFARPPAMCLC